MNIKVMTAYGAKSPPSADPMNTGKNAMKKNTAFGLRRVTETARLNGRVWLCSVSDLFFDFVKID